MELDVRTRQDFGTEAQKLIIQGPHVNQKVLVVRLPRSKHGIPETTGYSRLWLGERRLSDGAPTGRRLPGNDMKHFVRFSRERFGVKL